MTKSASIATELKDPRLFREACYVDGQWIQASSGQTMDVDNPATKEIIGKVPKLSGVEARCAIKAAKNAFPAW
ncbi:MAG: aldehyde dehydrogenase family protein, partial [Candidatus Acidiferrum sp.]